MSPRQIAQAIAAGRVVIGAALVASPALVTRRWVDDTSAPTRTLAIGLGARDVAIGAGVLAALNAGGDTAKPWLLGSALADVFDLTAALRASSELPGAAVAGSVAVAGGAAAAGLWLLTRDDL